MKKVEILSPVGNMEMFYQAVHNGCDAVYLAGTSYGARKFARNFTEDELIEVIQYAHLYGVKVYVTVNTLIFEHELENVIKYLGFLHQNGCDAVIMQDMGVISVARKIYPNLEIHASTQCHNHNKEITSLWKDLGLTRVVFAREMSLQEIKNIDVEIEKEVFVYGALCVSYSGCCLFSSLNGGRSGNRGECVGSCRLPYKLICNDKIIDTKGSYLLSTKELNTLEQVKELIESGIDSFKIEGRMKSPAYVGYVTRLYRTLVDKYYKNEELVISNEEMTNLKKIFNREFTKGYLFKDKDIMNIKTPNHLGVEIGKVIDIINGKIKIKLTKDALSQNDGIRFQKLDNGMIVNRLYNEKKLLVNKVEKENICYLDNRLGVKRGDVILKTIDYNFLKELEQVSYKKIPIKIEVKCFIDKPLEVIIDDNINKVSVTGATVSKAIKREVTLEEIKRQINKLGNTPFVLKEQFIQKDEKVFVNLKDLNEIRRKAIEELSNKRKTKDTLIIKNTYNEDSFEIENRTNKKINISVLVRNEEQLKCCLDNLIDTIYVTDYNLYLKYKNNPNIYYRLDRVNSNYLPLSNERLLIGELGSMKHYYKNNTLIGDYYLNVVNHYSINFLREFNVKRITLSPELDNSKIEQIMKKSYPIELIIYGRIELMVMKYCPLKKILNYCSNCKNSTDKFYLSDKFNNHYPMIRKNCLTHIMHYQVLDKIDQIKQFQDMGINHYRLELFDENKEQLKKLITRINQVK